MFLLLFGMAAAAAAAEPPEDFYEALLPAGRDSYRDGNPLEAMDSLRVASFSLLGKPAPLCESVARLALAQESAGRGADAATTLDPILDRERWFSRRTPLSIPLLASAILRTRPDGSRAAARAN